MAVTVQGYKFSRYLEGTTFGTADAETYPNIRLDADPTITTSAELELEIGNKGFGHWADRDKPVTYEAGQESALTTPIALRQHSQVSEKPFVIEMFESCGCDLTYTETDTIASAADVSTFELTTGTGARNGVGYGYLTINGESTPEYWTSLAAAYSSKTVTTFWDLPHVADTGASKAVYTYTVTPRSQSIPVGSGGKTYTFKMHTRETFTSGEDWMWTFSGCACANPGELVLEPNKKLVMSPTWHVADVAASSESISAATEAWHDDDPVRTFGPYTYVGLATAPSPITTGSVARAANELSVLKATINFGISTTPIPGSGTNTINGWQGYISQYDPAAAGVTLELLFDDDHYDQWVASNATKSLWIEQGSTSLTAQGLIWAFCMPQCFIAAPPQIDHFSGPYHKVTVRYAPLPSEFSTTAGNDSEQNVPWYFIAH